MGVGEVVTCALKENSVDSVLSYHFSLCASNKGF